MSDSFRISINEIDRSGTVRTSVGVTGAMVVRSTKGESTPKYIPTGNERKIINLYGKPSSATPDVWEAIQFNRVSPLWISAPFAATDTLAGALLTDQGTIGLGTGNGIVAGSLDSYTFPVPVGDDPIPYAVLVTKSPTANDDFGIKASYDATTEIFTVSLYVKYNSKWDLLETMQLSLTEGATGDYGKDIYIGTVLKNHDYLDFKINGTPDLSTGFADDADVIAMTGGVRDTASLTASDLVTAWQQFQKGRQYKAAIFMDPSAEATVAAEFEILRGTYQKYASYIVPLPVGEDVSTAIATKQGMSLTSRGLAVYWNHGKVDYLGNEFWTSLVGRIGLKYALMSNVYNALSPAGIDENNHGGQLGSGIIEMEYDPSEDEVALLEAAGINPIVFDPALGVMIRADRTAVTPSIMSDDSFIGSSRLFDYILENFSTQVLAFQVMKLNDDIHRQLAIRKGDAILAPIRDEGYLDSYKIKCDLQNNDGNARSERRFVYSVAVKVVPNSQWIDFNFIKTGQSLTVEEVLN